MSCGDDDSGIPCEASGLRKIVDDVLANKPVLFGLIAVIGALVYVVFIMEDRSAEGASVMDGETVATRPGFADRLRATLGLGGHGGNRDRSTHGARSVASPADPWVPPPAAEPPPGGAYGQPPAGYPGPIPATPAFWGPGGVYPVTPENPYGQAPAQPQSSYGQMYPPTSQNPYGQYANQESQRSMFPNQESQRSFFGQPPPQESQRSFGQALQQSQESQIVLSPGGSDADTATLNANDDDDATPDAPYRGARCCICTAARATHFFEPCGHKSVCADCVVTLSKRKVLRCPVCRCAARGLREHKGPPPCAICKQHRSSHAFLPCHHKAACKKCARKLEGVKSLRCPVCRHRAHGLLDKSDDDDGCSEDEESVDAPPPCCICQDSDRTHAFIPCGHMAVCGDCAEDVRRQKPLKCPLCKTRPTSLIKIFSV